MTKARDTNPVNDIFMARLGQVQSVGRYEIIRELGRGGTAVVFMGRDPYIQRNVAIKMSQPINDEARKRFFLEAQSAGRLSHPNIVAVHDAGEYGDFCYIAMEYVDGPTLEKFCRADNLLPVTTVVETMFAACNALEYAHGHGVVHRDIKPSNIMLNPDNQVKITDFGIAQMVEQTTEAGIWGTPSYMSPEQLKDEGVGSNTDIFSLGCVLYELLCGHKAFDADNNFSIMYKITHTDPVPLAERAPAVPDLLGRIVAKALEKDPARRYQSCRDLAFELRVVLRGLVGPQEEEKAATVIDYVQQVPFFSDFSRDQVRQLVSASNVEQVPPERVVVTEGEIDDTFYVILSGQARIEKKGEQIATISVGECFGEMAYIGGQARVASVIADTECVLLKISATLLDRAPMSIQLLFFKNFAKFLVRRFSMFFKNEEAGA